MFLIFFGRRIGKKIKKENMHKKEHNKRWGGGGVAEKEVRVYLLSLNCIQNYKNWITFSIDR